MKEASHVYAYYAGNAHLVLKVWQFISESSGRPLWLYLVVSPKASDLLTALVRQSPRRESIILRELEPLAPDLDVGAPHLKGRLAGLMWQARKEGAERVCLVIDLQHEIEKHGLGGADLLRWERSCHEAWRGVGVETLCLHEARRAMDDHKAIRSIAQLHDRVLAEISGQE